MPFTLSHAAAVLPLVRGSGAARPPFIASAPVAGSFAPDVPYFADTYIRGTFGFGTVTHGLPGAVTVDVLISAALVGGGWLLVREPLVALLYAAAARALTPSDPDPDPVPVSGAPGTGRPAGTSAGSASASSHG